MPYFTDTDLLIGLDKELGIAKRKIDESIYAKFVEQIDNIKERYSNVLKTARQSEINWHADVAQTKDVIKPAAQMYIKWKNMFLEELPGANLSGWSGRNLTPDEIEIAIENIMNLIELNKEKLEFADVALDELEIVSNDLDSELNEDRKAYRKYRQHINKKNKLRLEAKELFYSIRRFIRRDCGLRSVEYAQIKDRAIKELNS